MALKRILIIFKNPWLPKDRNEIVRNYPRSRYDVLPDKHLVFQRMMPSQLAARAALVRAEAVKLNGEELSFGNAESIAEKIREELVSYHQQHGALLSFLKDKLCNVPLFGVGGLKDRSGLGEFRYDVV